MTNGPGRRVVRRRVRVRRIRRPTPHKPARFETPDGVRDWVKKLCSKGYVREYLRWLRRGPDETRDRRRFAHQWQRARARPAGRDWVVRDYEMQRERRMKSLDGLKVDINTFFTQLGLLFVVFGVVAQDFVAKFLQAPLGYAIWLIPAAWYFASSAHTPTWFYSWVTHFLGVAEYAEVIDQKSYTNKLRRDINHLGRTIQRGRRAYDIAKLCMLAVLLAVFTYLLF